MARSAKPATFILLALLLSPLLAEARSGKFLGKAEAPVVVPSVSVSPSPSPSISYSPSPTPSRSYSPSPSPASAPEIVPPKSSNGYYGLFGQESTEFPPAKRTTTATTTTSIGGQEKEFQSETLAEDFAEEETRKGNPYNSYSNNNNAYSNNNNYYNTNGYGSNSYSTNNNNYYNTNSYGSNNYNSVNGHELTQKQGMSDTRFLENGKYYVNNNNNNQNNNYYTTSNNYGNGYETETITSRGSSNEGYDGNFNNPQTNSNEFDSMEEYERQQGYPEIQGQYIP